MRVAFPGQSLKAGIGVLNASLVQFLRHSVVVVSFKLLTDRHSASEMTKRIGSIHKSSEQDVYLSTATDCYQSV